MWRQVRGPAGAVMCETCALAIQWSQRHTCGHEIRLSEGCEEDALETDKINLLEGVDSEARM